MPEFTHTGIHQWHTGHALLPGLQKWGLYVPPGELVKLWPEILGMELGEVEKDVVGELTPAHLREKLGLVLLGVRRKSAIKLSPDLMGAYFPKTQVRTESRCRHRTRLIPSVIELQGVVDKIFKSLVGSGLSRRPHLVEAGGPVRARGKQIPVVEGFARNSLSRLKSCRGWKRRARWLAGQCCPPERGENFEGVTLSRSHRPGLKQQIPRKTFAGQP